MGNKITRKDFLRHTALFTAGVATLGVGSGVIGPKKAFGQSNSKATWPWPYQELDPEKVRKYGHDNFWNGYACCAGAFDAIIRALQEEIGDPYTDFPTKMMIYGHGGGAGWGTICGALNGAAAAISLVTEKSVSDQLVQELNGWYTEAKFPSDESNAYAIADAYEHNDFNMELVQNISNSPLCHVSVTKWCNAADIAVGANERKERCARLAGDVAAKAVELLNAYFASTFEGEYVTPADVTTCLACHGSDGVKANVATKQSCTPCHGDPHAVSGVSDFNDLPETFEIRQNSPNPFNNETIIEFSLKNNDNVSLDVYSINGQHIKTLINNKSFSSGKHSVVWDGNDEFGSSVSGGMYIYQLRSNGKTKTKSMIKL